MQEILTNQQIEQKINRIAHEIIENSSDFPVLYLAGVSGNGMHLAQLLAELISKFAQKQMFCFEIRLDKDEPLKHPITTDFKLDDLQHGFVVLIDDVVNSGKTMQYALTKLLSVDCRMIKTAALVDRVHRRYPIRCDYVGMTLSTTLQERVEVDFNESGITAYLV